jgi:hypothetical protein
MYRSCIFCSAPLGSNEAIERFPVGRSLAFDGEKGRLWAVCPRCARWNLAPIEERWEAIEDAERLFRDTRLRVQRESIGLAKLRDGSRLIRVGEALPGELAAWRYGQTLFRRRWSFLLGQAGVALGSVAALAGGATLGLYAWREYRQGRVVHRVLPHPREEGGIPVIVRRRDLVGARLLQPEGGGIGIHFPQLRELRKVPRRPGDDTVYARVRSAGPLTITGEPARVLLTRAMVHVNSRGAPRDDVEAALRWISVVGSPDAFVRNAARAARPLIPEDGEAANPMGNLALEIALHEETERRALDGELAMLEAMWRQAEGIAAIADRLPDLPPPDPPRLETGG